MLPPRAVLLTLLVLGACGPLPPAQQPVSLPTSAQPAGAGDPTRGAILSSSFVFGQPGSVAGNPAAVAEALGQLEYLAVELAVGPQWIDMDPLVVPMLAQGRAEARSAFGFNPTTSPQSAMDALFAAAAALRAGDPATARTALVPLTSADRAEATLQRLDALPPLPRAAAATARAQQSLMRRDSSGDRRRTF